MPRNGSGNYIRPQADYTPGTTILSSSVNSDLNDMATALTASIARDGQTTPTGNLPMSGFRHTGVANGAARTDYAALGQVQDGAFLWGGTAGGTANAITISLNPPITTYGGGLVVRFISSATNTGSVTLNVNSLGAVALNKGDGTVALMAGDIPANALIEAIYDGTRFRLGSVNAAFSDLMWRPVASTTVTGSPVGTVDFNISSWATFFRVEWGGAAPSGATAPFCAQISQDNGSTYLSGVSDYGGVIMDIRSSGGSFGSMPSGRLDLSTSFTTAQTIDGSITIRRVVGAPCDIASWGIDSIPSRVRRVAHGGGGTLVPTNLRFFFAGTSVAVGSTFTAFAR